MARDLEQGETVYVPRSSLDLTQEGSVFYRTRVLDVLNRSVRISLPEGETETIGSSQVRRNIGVLLINAGDFKTENTLLNPLAKSILQYFRLLLEDDMVLSMSIRSKSELFKIWRKYSRVYTHVALVGHGSKEGVKFGVDGMIGPEELAEVFEEAGSSASSFVSLCCKNGYAKFAKKFSKSDACDSIIAPFHTVHGAAASQFCQTFFSYHLLEGETLKIAFKHARDTVPGSTSFRLWQDGDLVAGKNT
jgi:hypothetical protein